MKKENVKLFEKIEITDPEYAKKLYEKESKKWNLKLICTIIAAVGSVCGFLCMSDTLDKTGFLYDLVQFVWFVGLVAMLVAGSVINTLKLIFKVGQLGYYIVPFVLLDLIGFVFGLAFGLIITLMLPVVPAAMTLYQSWQNKKTAEEYLALDAVMNKENYAVNPVNNASVSQEGTSERI